MMDGYERYIQEAELGGDESSWLFLSEDFNWELPVGKSHVGILKAPEDFPLDHPPEFIYIENLKGNYLPYFMTFCDPKKRVKYEPTNDAIDDDPGCAKYAVAIVNRLP